MNTEENVDYRDEQITAVNAAIGAGGYTIYTLTLNEWVAIITIGYLLLQIGLLFPKYVEMFKKKKKKKR